MASLPNEIILMILKHRRNISWNIHKKKTHNILKNCLLTNKITRRTNFDFRGYYITYYQGSNVEIIISQRPNWVVVSYVFMVPTPHPKQIGIETQKIVYCPMYHLE